jgi:hypothetical protein
MTGGADDWGKSMAQAGIHALVGMAVGRWTPQRTWLSLGLVLGNMLPDADILIMAVATRWDTSSCSTQRSRDHPGERPVPAGGGCR